METIGAVTSTTRFAVLQRPQRLPLLAVLHSERAAMENKNRFSTLRVFKLSSKPPPPPPKDAPGPFNISPYNPYLSNGASTSQLTLGSYQQDQSDPLPSSSTQPAMLSPSSDESRYLSPSSPNLVARSPSPSRSPPSAGSFKKSLTRLSPFGKKSKSVPNPVPHSPSLTTLPEQQDEEGGVSKPWNFQVSRVLFVPNSY